MAVGDMVLLLMDNSCTCVVVSANGSIRFASLQVILPAVHPEFVKGRQCIQDVPPSAPALNPPSARDQMSAPSRTASSTKVFYWVCIVCAMPSKFCRHYASTYSKAGTPTSATSCVYGSSPPCRNGPRHHSLCQSNETFHSSPSFAQDIPVPFPIDPHFAQHAQPNLQYVRDVEVWQRFDFVIVRPNNVAKV